ncbi:MAG: Ig-like domain-containing protein [Oscillospiraceae bacterium]|nr:Ig-like domain-containing protein [Oscillospiraceae bacterium]
MKKILCLILTVALILTVVIMPSATSSSTTETIIFSNGEARIYAIEVTAEQNNIAMINFAINDSIILSHFKGSTLSLNGNSRTHFARISEASFLNNEVTASIQNCRIFGGENSFVPGMYNRFHWTGRIVLNENTSAHPETELGINMNNIVNTLNITMNISAQSLANSFTVPLLITNARVIQIDNDAVINAGSSLRVRDLNGGFGLTTVQRTRMKNGRDFRLMVNLNEPLTGSTIFNMRTDLNQTSIQAIGNRGDTRVSFPVIPISYFYDEVNSSRFGSDIFFENMIVSGGIHYRNVQLSFSDGGAVTTTTTPPMTTTPSTATFPEEPDPGIPSTAAYINFPTITLNPGASATLRTDIDPAGIRRTTTNPAVCRVFTSGRIEAVAPGTATIAITNTKGERVTCVVTVRTSAIPHTSFRLNSTGGTVFKDHSYTLARFTRTPANSTDTINWSSSDPKIATVSRTGAVRVLGTGTVEITALTSGGISSTSRLTARNPVISITNGTSRSVSVGRTITINTRVGPSSSILSFRSSNSSVARVNNSGVVTAVSRGTAVITITSNKGAPERRVNVRVS